jgi:hypothetical protein
MITPMQQDMIDQVIDMFNFEKVLITMHALDWKWVEESGKAGHSVPSIKRMKNAALRLLTRSVADTCCGSGGFEATYYPPDEENKDGAFALRFVVTQSFSTNDW